MPHLAIVGGGFSGAAFAIHLLAHAGGAVRITLIDPSPEPGRGLAYGTRHHLHRLNVPAQGMALFPDATDDFQRWVEQRGLPATDPAGHGPGGFYALRWDFGSYIAERLAAAAAGRPFATVRARALDVVRRGDGFAVPLAGGEAVAADAVVLALGNDLPGARWAPPWLRSHLAWVGDPWQTDRLAQAEPDAPVVVVGAGLTAVDAAAALLDRGHRGGIALLSRRGLLPRPHTGNPGGFDAVAGSRLPDTAAGLVRFARAAIARAADGGRDWRDACDSFRTHAPALWKALPPDEQARFLRHGRAFWEAHRYRMAPPLWKVLQPALADGRLAVRAARRPVWSDEGARVAVQSGGRRIGAALVVNATGPDNDLALGGVPLLGRLCASGIAVPDPRGLGLTVDDEDRVLAASGSPWAGLAALGGLTRGRHGEITAVSEIAVQARRVAGRLHAHLLGSAAAGT